MRPPVIDLTAEEIRDKPAEEESAPSPTTEASAPSAAEARDAELGVAEPPPAVPPIRSSWRKGWLWGGLATVLLGLLVGAWLYRDYGQRYWPSDAVLALSRRVEALDAATRTAASQVSGLAQEIEGLKARTGELAEAIDQARAQAGETSTGLAALQDSNREFSGRVDQLEAGLKSATAMLDALRKTAGTGGTDAPTASDIDAAALAGLEQRVGTLEAGLAELKAQGGAGGGAEAGAVLSQALSDLKAKFAAGAPFEQEFDRIARMVPAAPGLDQLSPHAQPGIPNAGGLAGELEALIPTLPGPRGAPPGAEPPGAEGTWEWLVAQLGGLVKVRSLDDPDWRGLAERARVLAADGQLAQAATLIDEAPGDLPAALNEWRARVRARLGAEAAIAEVEAAVLRQIASLGAP